MPDAGVIRHILLLMQENRSFDHYFGALNLEGRHDLDGLEPGRFEGRNEVAQYTDTLPDNHGTFDNEVIKPWPMDGVTLDPDVHRDPPHEWPEVQRQYNGGLMDGFVRAYQDFYPERGSNRGFPSNDEARHVMGYYTRKTLPVAYALADEFVVCDRWFSSFLGSTWPNRVCTLAGGCGNLFTTGDLRRWNAYEYPQCAFPEWDIEWKAYSARVGQLSTFDLWRGFPVYRSDHGGDFDDFAEDCKRGTLPQVAFIEPDYALEDDHYPHDVKRGQVLIRRIVRTLLTSPSWAHTLLIITYDEHGGFFDHVQPPMAPEPHADSKLALLGMRVPTVVVSPYSPQRQAVHTTFDHTTFLKTVAERWDLPVPGERAQHQRTASLWDTDCLDFSQAERDGKQIARAMPRLRANRSLRTAMSEANRSLTDLEVAMGQLAKLRRVQDA